MSYRRVSFPFRLNNLGGVSTTEQGTINHIEENITQILTTLKGERAMLPNYGCEVDFSLFENIETPLYNILVRELVQSITSQETQIDLSPEDIHITSEDNKVLVSMRYTLKLDGSSHNYNLQL